MRRLLLAFVVVVAGLAASGQPPPACRTELNAALDRIHRLGRTGVDEHRALLAEIRRLIARHADAPAECRSDLQVEEITLLNFLDEYPEAIRLSNLYLAGPLGSVDPTHRAFVLRVRGYAHEATGQTVAGAQDYFAAAALAPHLRASHALESLLDAAETAAAMGQPVQAQRFLDRAERVMRDSLTSDPHVADIALGRISSARVALLAERADPDSAHAHTLESAARVATEAFERSLAHSRDVRVDHAKAALAWSARAMAMAWLGQASDARSFLQTAVHHLHRSEHVSRDAGHQVWMRAGRLLLALDDRAGAEAAAHTARDEARRSGVLAHEARALEALAGHAEAAQRWDDAERLYREALALREIERERLELQDWSVSAFAASQVPYRGLARLLAHQGRVEEAFVILDQSRARHLRDLRAHLALRDPLAMGGGAALDSLLTQIEEARLALMRSSDVDAQAAATVRLSQLQASLQRATGVASVDPVFSVDALQESLRETDRTLVSYLVEPDEAFAFVVTPDTVVGRRLPTSEREIVALLFQAQGPWASTADPALSLAPLHRLHQVLLTPVEPWLGDGRALVVIPDGVLADLPFPLLIEQPPEEYASARYLVRSRTLSTELAAALLLEPAPAYTAGQSRLFVLGRSRFAGAEASRSRTEDAVSLADLPWVRREARRVAAQVRGARLALDRAATEAFARTALRGGRVVHVASHASPNTTHPLHARIHLWPDREDDGQLHLYELRPGSTRADLVVLSGCATAGGPAERGEGTIGLHYGLRAAGARATLATLWPVDDRATALIMQPFYEALARGVSKDLALRTAQLAYLDAHAGVESSPFYWASFVLTGHAAPVDLASPRHSAWGWGSAAALVLALLWLAHAHRRRARATPTV